MEYLFILGRVLLGGYFIRSGYMHFKHLAMMTGYAQSKGVPMASGAVMLTGLMMLFGGAGVLLGAYVAVSISLLAFFLLITTFQMHRYWEIQDPMQRMGEQVNFYKNLGLLGAVLMLYAIPSPWMASLMF